MAKIVAAEFVSLDGYIADSSGPAQFYSGGREDAMPPELARIRASGAPCSWGAWPNIPGEGNPIAESMISVPQVVFSKTLKSAPWGRTGPRPVIGTGVEAEVEKQKARPGKDAAILGSARFLQILAEFGLIDEYEFMMYPTALGRGKEWAPAIGRPLKLRLAKSRAYPSGIAQLR